MNLKKIYNSLSNEKYNIQEVYYCYEITLEKIKRDSLKCNLSEIIMILILNLKNKTYQNKTKFYKSSFAWKLSAEQAIIYAILIFYDLREISKSNFLKQFEREMRLYSTDNARQRINNLMRSFTLKKK